MNLHRSDSYSTFKVGDYFAQINLAPLIGIILVLAVLKIVEFPPATHGMDLKLPVGTPPPPSTEPSLFIINVDFDGTLGFEGAEMLTDREMSRYLKWIASIPSSKIFAATDNGVTFVKGIPDRSADSNNSGGETWVATPMGAYDYVCGSLALQEAPAPTNLHWERQASIHTELWIEPHKLTEYKDVIKVMAMARNLGVENVTLGPDHATAGVCQRQLHRYVSAPERPIVAG